MKYAPFVFFSTLWVLHDQVICTDDDHQDEKQSAEEYEKKLNQEIIFLISNNLSSQDQELLVQYLQASYQKADEKRVLLKNGPWEEGSLKHQIEEEIVGSNFSPKKNALVVANGAGHKWIYDLPDNFDKGGNQQQREQTIRTLVDDFVQKKTLKRLPRYYKDASLPANGGRFSDMDNVFRVTYSSFESKALLSDKADAFVVAAVRDCYPCQATELAALKNAYVLQDISDQVKFFFIDAKENDLNEKFFADNKGTYPVAAFFIKNPKTAPQQQQQQQIKHSGSDSTRVYRLDYSLQFSQDSDKDLLKYIHDNCANCRFDLDAKLKELAALSNK